MKVSTVAELQVFVLRSFPLSLNELTKMHERRINRLIGILNRSKNDHLKRKA